MVEYVSNELAVLFKRIEDEDNFLCFVPFKIIEGHYDEDTRLFVDKKGYSYAHISYNDPGHGYGYRMGLSALTLEFPDKSLQEIKKSLLQEVKKWLYFYIEIDGEEQLVRKDKHSHECQLFASIDEDTDQSLTYDLPIQNDENGQILAGVLLELLQKTTGEYNPELLAKLEEVKKNQIPVKQESFDINHLHEILKQKVFGQDEGIESILSALWYNYTAKDIARVKNIFVVGPPGVGKTEVFRIIADEIKVPCIIETANHFTIDGYKGRDTSDMLRDLLNKANGNLQNAQRGILIIDEIDKLASINRGETSDIATTGVQNSLLKIVEGGIFPIDLGKEQIDFDTNHLTVVSIGAFAELFNPVHQKHMGFNTTNDITNNKKIKPDDIVKYGITPEYMRRHAWFTVFNNLKEEDYFNIIKHSKLSALKEAENFYNSLGIEFVCDDEFILEIAKKAVKYNEGAGGIEKALAETLTKTYIDTAFNKDKKGYKKLVLSKKTTIDNTDYSLD